MREIFFKLISLLNKVTGKKFLYITPNQYNDLGKTAVWCDLGFWYVGNVYNSSDIAYGIAQNGIVEKEDTSLVTSILNTLDSPNVYDIGANTGYYGIFAATRFNASVYAFEPIPDYISCIKESSRINRVEDRVTTHTLALGDHESELDLNLSGSGSTLAKDFLGDTPTPHMSVAVRTLDSLDLPTPDFIKIDVEGYEWEVLQGAYKTISRYQPICFIEIAKTLSERNFVHSHFEDIIEFFEKMGYKIERNTKNGLVAIDNVPDGVSMYLCKPLKQ
ncbi:hypothetical protein CL644_01500 [bacterium]|nr:hypothetical protein [bacterium]|tara:strand:+ start:11124 stop:11948 length:825 start_codon:yes stop_codon:yes gene_type:complete